MTSKQNLLTGKEQHFDKDEIIVSKTDLKGRLTYMNNVFIRISGFSEKELLGRPHKIIRHPEMPRAIFKTLWSCLEDGKEIFAYVINKTKNGDYYWVLAHVTPSRDISNKIIGYHSNRRVANKETLEKHVIPLYSKLLEEEKKYDDRKKGLDASMKIIKDILEEKNMSINQFIFSI